MTKKIKRIRLTAGDINKNSGKEISHTITKIKKHEKLYTFILVVVFMITISLSVFLGLNSDKYKLYDASYYSSSISLKGQMVALLSDDIMSDEEGLKSKTYDLEYSNNTGKTINFIIRFALDEDIVKKCNCRDKIAPYGKLKYSIDGENVKQFTEETMIITTGMLPSRESDTLKVHLWLDDSLKNNDCLYYGKFVLEQLEDMDN